MSKKSRLRGCFDKQYGKRAQTLLKSPSQHLYYFLWLLARKLYTKRSLLLTFQILRLLVSTMASNETYPALNRDNLTIPIQMQLSQKKNISSAFFPEILKSKFNFEHFEKKRWPPQLLYFRNYGLWRRSYTNV